MDHSLYQIHSATRHRSIVNATNIDRLFAAVNQGTHDPLHDLTDDDQVTQDDVDELVRNILNTGSVLQFFDNFGANSDDQRLR